MLARSDAVIVPVLPNGLVDLEALENLLAARTEPTMVSIMMANNETGIVQPIADIARQWLGIRKPGSIRFSGRNIRA